MKYYMKGMYVVTIYTSQCNMLSALRAIAQGVG